MHFLSLCHERGSWPTVTTFGGGRLIPLFFGRFSNYDREASVLDFPLSGAGPCSTEARRLGFTTFAQIAEHVRNLPYGRIEQDLQGLAVLHQGRGTCSSKHKLLAILARECARDDVRLTLGFYEMSERNTPGISEILNAAELKNILEAHCYLTWQGRRYDFTGLPGGFTSPFESLTEERHVVPEDLPAAKRRFHRDAVIRWAKELGIDSDKAWKVREQCIAALSRVGSGHRGAFRRERL